MDSANYHHIIMSPHLSYSHRDILILLQIAFSSCRVHVSSFYLGLLSELNAFPSSFSTHSIGTSRGRSTDLTVLAPRAALYHFALAVASPRVLGHLTRNVCVEDRSSDCFIIKLIRSKCCEGNSDFLNPSNQEVTIMSLGRLAEKDSAKNFIFTWSGLNYMFWFIEFLIKKSSRSFYSNESL